MGRRLSKFANVQTPCLGKRSVRRRDFGADKYPAFVSCGVSKFSVRAAFFVSCRWALFDEDQWAIRCA